MISGHNSNQIDFPGVILAGGLSRRMGQSKQTVVLAGRTMLDHVIERFSPQTSRIAINTNDSSIITDLPCIADTMKHHPGPLAGIAAAMQFAQRASSASHVLTTPVDTPFIPHNLGRGLRNALRADNAVVLACSKGRVHPVIGLWPVQLHAHITEWLGNPQNRKLMAFLDDLPVVAVEFAEIDTKIGPLDPFFNVNTPDDLAQAELYLKAIAP